MVLKTVRIAMIAGGLALSFCFASRSQAATASSTEPCPEPSDCLVPAPTVMMPISGHQYIDSVVITGLSWNETHVDVYIDGVLHGRAELRQDLSGVGNFVYRPLPRLSPGAHTLYTVAWNLSDKERSFDSLLVPFTAQPFVITPTREQSTKPVGGAVQGADEGAGSGASANEVIDEYFKDTTLSTSTATATNQLMTFAGGLKVGIIIIAVVAAVMIYRFRMHRTPSQSSTGSDGPPEELTPPGDFKPPSG